MAKYNAGTVHATGRGPLATEAQPSGKTHEGGTGYTRDTRSELFLRATTSFAGEDSFYEEAAVHDGRLRQLVTELAVDPDGFQWLQGFLPWLRGEGNMRTAPVLLAAEAVHARLAKGLHGGGRQLVSSVLQRADEPGELLAYWVSRHGRAIPKPVKRGVADAVCRLYSERAFLRNDSDARGYRFGDVIDLVHPSPKAPADLLDRLPPEELESLTASEVEDRISAFRKRQGALFEWAIITRHNRSDEPPSALKSVRARYFLNRFDPDTRHRIARKALEGDEGSKWDLDRASASSWEWLLSWLGQAPEEERALTKAEQWQLILPKLGFMAAIRNLRNIDEAGLSDEIAAALAARIADPEEVKQSRQLPFRFLSAYMNVPSLRWGHALEKALDASLANIPELGGRTLVLIDTSASMGSRMSGKSQMSKVQAAALFGLALALKNPRNADVWGFADGQFQVTGVEKGHSVLKATELFCRQIGKVGHGTQIAAAVRATYKDHDRVCIFTDMQTFLDRAFPERSIYSSYGVGDVTGSVPAHIPAYGFNLAGYTHSAMPAGHGSRHELGGLSDATFRLIPQIEAGQTGMWPWLEKE